MSRSQWLTLSEYLSASGLSRRTFFRRRTAIESRTVDGILKFSAASLTEEARTRLEGQRAVAASTGAKPVDAALMPLFAASPLATQEATRVALSPDAARVANERLAILQPLLDFISDKSSRTRFTQLKTADGKKVSTSNDLTAYLSELHSCGTKKISARTLWNWKKAYTDQGLHGLARGIRKDKGQSRFFVQNTNAAKLVASVYLKPFQTVVTAYNALLRESDKLGIPDVELPSYNTVRSYLESLPAPIKVLAREGERAHNERMSLYLQRSYTDIAVNQIWVSDHMIHDVEVRNDCFHGVDQNAPMRLQFTCLMDMRSRKIVGYSWTPNGSSRSITTALRRAVEQYGPCEIFYCDNGKDYQKVARQAQPAANGTWYRDDLDAIEKAGVVQRLGMKVQYCIKYHPQSKPIERMFGTMHKHLDSIMPHYTTGNAYLKPDYTVIAMAEHRKLLRWDRGSESPLVPASHFIRMATVWVEEHYNAAHRHTGKGMDGHTPNEVFDAGYSEADRRSFDPAILETLLWSRERRRVRECSVTLSGRRYMASSASCSAAMYLQNEQDVLVCFDPLDMDRAIVADLDGRKIADVQAERLVANSAEAAPMIAASMQERRRLRNASAHTVRSVRNDVAMAGHRSDVEILHERALLPAAVDDYITQRAPQTATAEHAVKHLHSEDIGDRLAARLRRNNGTHG